MARLPTGVSLFAVQLLNGPSIMAPILAIMLYIERRVAPHLIASAQGMYVPAWSACMALAMLACGPLWHTLQAGAYFVMALIAAAGGVMALCAWQASAGGVRTALRFVQ
jgi:hypothetical protein